MIHNKKYIKIKEEFIMSKIITERRNEKGIEIIKKVPEENKITEERDTPISEKDKGRIILWIIITLIASCAVIHLMDNSLSSPKKTSEIVEMIETYYYEIEGDDFTPKNYKFINYTSTPGGIIDGVILAYTDKEEEGDKFAIGRNGIVKITE